MSTPNKSIVLISQVAIELDVPEATLRGWRHRGSHLGLPIHKGENGKLFCFRKDLTKFKKTWPWG